MSLELFAGIALAIVGMGYAMLKSGGDIRWGLTSGVGAAILIMVVLLFARTF